MTYNLNIPGWMTENDLRILNQLASCVPENGNILEVGSFLGRSTSALFSGKPPGAHLVTIDKFELSTDYPIDIDQTYLKGSEQLLNEAQYIASTTGSWLEAFRHCITPQIADQITINAISSQEYRLVNSFDMVFLDASHVMNDLVDDIEKFVKPTTLLVGDDFEFRKPGIPMGICSVRKKTLWFNRTLIVPENSKLWVMVPSTGYWKQLFQTNILV